MTWADGDDMGDVLSDNNAVALTPTARLLPLSGELTPVSPNVSHGSQP